MVKGYRYEGPMESVNDPLYEDTHGMTLTFSQMADRCLNTEITSIFLDRQEGDIGKDFNDSIKHSEWSEEYMSNFITSFEENKRKKRKKKIRTVIEDDE